MSYIIEIATSDYASTALAVAGGADRIELCANLEEGGTTASYGVIRQCREQFSIPIYPIIRPRGGDFLYTEEEFNCMIDDIRLCKDLGCDGIVAGILLSDGQINIKHIDEIMRIAYPLNITFHRAFDRCVDPFKALEELIELGVERILTSGQRPTAPEGVGLIRQLQEAAAERITIMPGSGVRKENIAELAKKTGCSEFHTSLRIKKPGNMQFIHPSFAGYSESYDQFSIDPEEIKQLRAALSKVIASSEG